MKNILVLCLMLISVCAISQTEQNATNSEVRGHDVTYYAAATCGLFSGTNPYTGQLTPKTNQTGVGAFVLSNAAIGDILVTNIGLYEIKATDNASSPTVTIQLINNPALANTAFPPTGDVAVIRPTSKGLLPSYISDGVIGLPFTTEAFIGNFNASQIDYQLSSLSSDKVLIPLVNNDGLAGKAVTINSSGEATLVDTSSAIAAIGIVETIDGATANVVTSGRVTITGHSFTIGDRLYLSETAGELTTVQYDESSQPMAYVEDANTLIVSPNAFHSAATAGGGGSNILEANATQTVATTHELFDNQTSALNFYSTGSSNIFTIKTTNGSEGINTLGNLGVGTLVPNDASTLDVVSITQGSRPVPNMTEAQRDLINGGTFVEGLQVYNTDTKAFNYYDGTSWIAVVTDADSYTHTFVSGDWGGVSGAYTLTITAATHGLGTGINNHNIYSDDGTSYISEVSTSVSINKTTGDVTLTSSSPTAFDGKITFKK